MKTWIIIIIVGSTILFPRLVLRFFCPFQRQVRKIGFDFFPCHSKDKAGMVPLGRGRFSRKEGLHRPDPSQDKPTFSNTLFITSRIVLRTNKVVVLKGIFLICSQWRHQMLKTYRSNVEFNGYNYSLKCFVTIIQRNRTQALWRKWSEFPSHKVLFITFQNAMFLT